MKGIQIPGIVGEGLSGIGPVTGGSLTTSLLELVDSVREEVEAMYSDDERLVTLIVYRLLGGEGLPVDGDYVRVRRRKEPPVSH